MIRGDLTSAVKVNKAKTATMYTIQGKLLMKWLLYILFPSPFLLGGAVFSYMFEIKDNDDLIFDTTTNLWLDAFLAGRGVILTMMTTATMTTKMRGDFDKDDHSNNNHKDDDNDNARTFHLCQEGGCQLG